MNLFLNKRLYCVLSCAFLLFACVFSSFGFDWKPKPNKELRADLLSYIENARKTTKDRKLITELDTLVKTIRKDSDDSYTWMRTTHLFVEKMLQLYPPEPKNSAPREIILRIFDYPLHFDETNNATPQAGKDEYRDVTFDFFEKAFQRFLKEFKSTKVKKGSIAIWNLYNMAYVIKGEKNAVAIDMTAFRITKKSNNKFISAMTPGDYESLAKLIDVCFVTHIHGDHTNGSFQQAMVKANKTVVLPASLPTFGPPGVKAKQDASTIIVNQEVAVPREIGKIKFQSFPGNQGEKVPCNVYLIEIDGIRILHGGDNYDRAQEKKVVNCEAPNLIIPASWNDMKHLIRCAKDAKNAKKRNQVTLPSHLNELGHRVQQRESYWELYTNGGRLGDKNFDYPTPIVLGWCEGFFYPSMTPISQKNAAK